MKVLIFILVIVLIALQYRLWVGEGSIANVVRLQKEITQQEQENKGLKARNALLSAEVDALKNGNDSIEERARTEMGLVKKNETFYMIVEKDKAQ